jgi:hypothetical protein
MMANGKCLPVFDILALVWGAPQTKITVLIAYDRAREL